jgi:hypothetical protein
VRGLRQDPLDSFDVLMACIAAKSDALADAPTTR